VAVLYGPLADIIEDDALMRLMTLRGITPAALDEISTTAVENVACFGGFGVTL
jgi:hypothetical protein